jgi:hypothetical protein
VTTEKTAKGPLWGLLGVLIAFAMMQLLRLLNLPDTFAGLLGKTIIQAIGCFVIVSYCVIRIDPRRFFAAAIPLMFLGNWLWPAFLRGLAKDDHELAVLFSVLAVGVGMGGMIGIWIAQGHRRAKQ